MILDTHFHMIGIEDGEHIRMSEAFKRNTWLTRIATFVGDATFVIDNELIRRKIKRQLAKSDLVDGVVALAFDQVYDDKGFPMSDKTHLYISNEYVADFADETPGVYLGASFHPNRRDLDTLRELKEKRNAVLIKWIPSAQNIQPNLKKYTKFYETLVDLRLPLLCHLGHEHTIPCFNENPFYTEYNNPELLKLPLDIGVTVIGAHCATPIYEHETSPGYFDKLIPMVEEYENLFLDISAFFLNEETRTRYVRRVRDELPHERLLFGTDFPCPPWATELWRQGLISSWQNLKCYCEENMLDKNVKLTRYSGFDECVLTNPAKILIDAMD